jgi:radial spoke head protein 3
MYDKRVFRGSTNAAMVIPSGNYPDALFDNRKERAKAKAQARAAAAEEFFTRDVRTPEPLQGRQNIDIQTDQFVEELTDKAPCYEIGCQTEIKIDRPQTPRFMPQKVGVDKKTLVEDNELFIFDFEVEPILSVLCGKTLELSRMEVLEEEELREMREQQEHYKRMTAAEVADIERMEATEAKRKADFEKQKANMREKKKNKQLAHRKVVARTIAKDYISNLREKTFTRLTDAGFYTDSFKIDVLDFDVVPWLHEKCFDFIQDLEVQDSVPTILAKDHLLTEEEEHIQTVKAEAERKK